MGQKIVFMAQQKKKTVFFTLGKIGEETAKASKDVNMGNFQSDIGFHTGGKRRGGRRLKKENCS